MGRVTTPRYRVEVECVGMVATPSAWRKHYGRPTEANLIRFLEASNASMAPGGCNQHIAAAFPGARNVGGRIVEQSTGAVVCTARI